MNDSELRLPPPVPCADLLTYIEGLRTEPPKHWDVVVRVSQENMEIYGESFRGHYFEPSMSGDFSHEDLDLVAGAFVTLAKSLPTSTYLLIDWIATCGAFEPDQIAEYAEDKFGMEPVKTPVRTARRKKRG